MLIWARPAGQQGQSSAALLDLHEGPVFLWGGEAPSEDRYATLTSMCLAFAFSVFIVFNESERLLKT